MPSLSIHGPHANTHVYLPAPTTPTIYGAELFSSHVSNTCIHQLFTPAIFVLLLSLSLPPSSHLKKSFESYLQTSGHLPMKGNFITHFIPQLSLITTGCRLLMVAAGYLAMELGTEGEV